MKPTYDTNELLPIEKVFRDPVHGYIHIQHQVILDLIDTKEFQRLRRIKQLGTASYTFHGAEHSRFMSYMKLHVFQYNVINPY